MKTIKFNQNGTGRYDDVSPFIITDNKLELKIELPACSGQFFFIAQIGEVSHKKFIPADGKIMLEKLSAGEFIAEVKHYLKGELIRSYKIEPLILREADGDLSAVPEMVELQIAVAVLEQSLVKEHQTVQEHKDEVTKWQRDVEQNIGALVKFAYSDFANSPYLSGGSIEQFAKEFGFTEQIIKIIGGKNND